MTSSRVQLLFSALILFSFYSCVERFEFESKNERPALVVDGYISDISSDEFKSMFYEPRYFYVKLKYSGAVKNSTDETISNAEVELINEFDEHWDYTEDISNPGTYYLYYPSFESQHGVKYKINIKLSNGEEYVSDYDHVTYDDVRGEISQEETTELQYEVVSSEIAIKPVDGLDVNIQLPDFSDSSFRYFRWDYHVTWILPAEFIPPSSPNGLCWIGDHFFFDEYALAKPKGASPSFNLFFLQTSGRRESKFGFAARIRQQEISERHHEFWTELQSQEEQSELFAPPPYNISTNINTVNNQNEAFGFFGVINEEFYTWYFDKKSLSYPPHWILECYVPPDLETPPWCRNCLGYATGITGGRLTIGESITNEKPKWWTF